MSEKTKVTRADDGTPISRYGPVPDVFNAAQVDNLIAIFSQIAKKLELDESEKWLLIAAMNPVSGLPVFLNLLKDHIEAYRRAKS